MFDDAFAHLESQVESAESCIAQLEIFDDAQRMQVVVKEKSVLAHGGVESFFAGVTERWMADIVHQCQRFDQLDVKAKLSCDGAGNLRDLDGVRQAIAKMIRVAASEDLGFGLKPAKSPGVNDAITVALKIVAVGMLRLGVKASAGLLHPHGVVGEHQESLTEADQQRVGQRLGRHNEKSQGIQS